MGLVLLLFGIVLLWALPLGGSLLMAVGALAWAMSYEARLAGADEEPALAVVPVEPEG